MSVAAMERAGAEPEAPRRGRPGQWLLPVALAMVLASAVLWLADRPEDRPLFPLRAVSLGGELRHVAEADLRRAIAPHLDGGLLALDVGRIRRAVEALPWVQRASVRRIWPDTLTIEIQEQRPLARWGNGALVNSRGQVFRPRTLPDGLAQLSGPAERREAVVRLYKALGPALAQFGLSVAELRLDARGAWRLRLDNGAQLELGTHAIEARLGRFLGALPQLTRPPERVPARVDLRYPNGFAIQWRSVDEARERKSNRTAQ